MDWNAIGTGVTAFIVGAGGVAVWWRQQSVNNAAGEAQTTAYDMLKQEMVRYGDRITALEQREGRMIRHIYRLEGLMRASGIEPPPFDIDGPPVGDKL